MREKELTPAQKEYRRFDKYRGYIVKTMVIFLVATLICFGSSFSIVDENPKPLLLFTCILIVLTIITIFICRYLARKGEQLYVAAYGNDTVIIRNGLFGELWQEFEWNQYTYVYKVAEAVGFEDPLYFSRAFKRKYGCCPSDPDTF